MEIVDIFDDRSETFIWIKVRRNYKYLCISMDGEGDRIVADGELTVLIKGKILNLFQKTPKRNEMLILGMVD